MSSMVMASTRVPTGCRPQWRALSTKPATTRHLRAPARSLTRRASTQFDWDSLPPGSKEVQMAAQAAEFKVRRGDVEGGKRTLRDAIKIISEQFDGRQVAFMGMLHTQLYQLHFVGGEYEEARREAQAAYECTVASFGTGSSEACLHGMRYGIALLACGEAAAAEPYLMEAGTMLESETQAAREAVRQAVLKGSQPTQADIMATTHLVAASGEAKFHAALCLLHREDPGTAERAQAMLLSGAEDMAKVMALGHEVMQCALREHQRLVDNRLLAAGADEQLQQRLAQQRQLLLKSIDSVQSASSP